MYGIAATGPVRPSRVTVSTPSAKVCRSSARGRPERSAPDSRTTTRAASRGRSIVRVTRMDARSIMSIGTPFPQPPESACSLDSRSVSIDAVRSRRTFPRASIQLWIGTPLNAMSRR